MTTQNPKLERLRPEGRLFERWQLADVRGMALLYDPPGRSFAEREGCPVLKCDLTDPRLALYAGLARAAELMEAVLCDLEACWLTPVSYHSTCKNSVNTFNLSRIRSQQRREEFAEFFRGLPRSVVGALPNGFPPRRVVTDTPWHLRLRFDKLQVWPRAFALVALLEPADEASASVLAMVSQKATTLNEKLVEMGLAKEPGPPPHVTLAYFSSEGDALAAKKRLGQCTKALPEGLRDLTVEHSSISLYGWTSMADFWPALRFMKWGNASAYAIQSEMLKCCLAEPDHPLDSLLHWMRHNDQAVVYLLGRAHLDSDFCFGSDDVGVLLSVLPEDWEKAAVPGYHPGSVEIYVTFQGSLLMDCMEGGRVTRRTITGNEVIVVAPGQCHRVSRGQTSHAASLIVKTNLNHTPGVVRCEECQYPDRTTCPLREGWVAEAGSASRSSHESDTDSEKEPCNGTF